MKTHDEKHWNACLPKWIVAFAAGMVVDKVINHTVIVLIGDQGIGKTTWIRRLLPEALSDYMHKVDMDGVMAQAYALYKSGFRYWMDKSDINVINKHNERFYAKSGEFL